MQLTTRRYAGWMWLASCELQALTFTLEHAENLAGGWKAELEAWFSERAVC
jgi:hypothetical protein